MSDILARLEATIQQRLNEAEDTSYVASLHAKGTQHIAQKIGEEGVELALALVEKNKQHIASEAADMLFHLLVGLHHTELSLNDVFAILEEREGMSGIEEKALRGR